MKKNKFIIDSSIEKLLNKESTYFLLPSEYKEVSYKLKKNMYKIYKPYDDSDKVILYTDKTPKVILFSIKTKNILRHQDILGSLYNLGLSNNTFGDIIVTKDNDYYFYILPQIKKIIENNLKKINNYYVSLVEEDINLLKDYKRSYETYEIVVPSTRLDVIVCEIVKTNRARALNIINNKDVIVNYNIQTKKSYILKENDIFSIRKYGKYKFIGITNQTKKDRFVVQYQKYL